MVPIERNLIAQSFQNTITLKSPDSCIDSENYKKEIKKNLSWTKITWPTGHAAWKWLESQVA